ncbi:MAG: hypothetical protein GXO58_03190 [Thermodesulfobacteria bacterium]|nr:hypothetical protein [Thermodesulfobacteriota bacterium]
MCQEIRKTCHCGRKDAQFHLRDNVLSPEVIENLYCPACSAGVDLNPDTMITDNGWIIEYDMDLARFLLSSKLLLDRKQIRPGFLFDTGYACWLEMYPGEKEDILAERAEIMKLQQRDPRQYLQEISRWNIERVERLKEEGWRKARAA